MAKTEIDFGDEEAVLAEIAKELDIDPDDLKIEEESGLMSFGTGTVYEITTHGGRKSWQVVENDDQLDELAIAVVTQDLEEDPSMFEKNFIESHIDKKKLRRELESDVLDMRIEDLTDTAERRPDDFWDDYEREGFEAPEEDEDGERPDPDDSQIEELAEKQAKEELRDPMEYLEGIYGDEAAAKAIEIAGIDIKAAAEEAVQVDGPGHFLSHYDGNYETSPSGLVYWRSN